MRCILVDTEAEFLRMECALGPRRSSGLDTETTLLDVFCDDFNVVGISLSGDTQTGYYIPIGHKLQPGKEDESPKQLPAGWVLPRLERFLAGRRTCGANHKFDTQGLLRHGVRIGTTTMDVLLAAPVHDSRDAMSSLANLVFSRLGYKCTKIKDLCAHVTPKGQSKTPERRKRLGFEYLGTEEALPYAAADAVDVVRLRDWYAPRIKADRDASTIMQLEMDLLPVVTRMEQVGFLLDEKKVRALHDKAQEMEDGALARMRALVGNPDLNPKSGAQVGAIIYHDMGIPHPRGRKLFVKGKTPPKGWMDKEILEQMLAGVKASPRKVYNGWSVQQAVEFLEARQLCGKASKFRTTYTLSLLDLISDDGRLHTDLRQMVQTGRTASSQPNLQNLPRADDPLVKHLDVRAAFIADPGWVFLRADYAAQEMRIMAALSQDPTMLAIFSGKMRDDRGDKIDIHAYVGCLAFEEPYLEIIDAKRKKEAGEPLSEREVYLVKVRQDSKPVNFGISYGISKVGLAAQIGCSEAKAQRLIDTHRTKAFAPAARWMDSQVLYLREHLYTCTVMGRKRHASGRMRELPQHKFQSLARQYQNHCIQGTGADLIKTAMPKVDAALQREFGDDVAQMVLIIHDELIVGCKREVVDGVRAVVIREMETDVLGVHFPVDAEVGKTMSKKG